MWQQKRVQVTNNNNDYRNKVPLPAGITERISFGRQVICETSVWGGWGRGRVKEPMSELPHQWRNKETMRHGAISVQYLDCKTELKKKYTCFFYVAQGPKSVLDRLIFGVSRSHAIRHTDTPGRLPCTSDQLVTDAATYRTNNKHKIRKSMPSTEFKPTISAIERL
jgi:hypothetical protein